VVAVIGYGSQGHVKQSGVRVIVGLRPSGPSWQRAQDDGLDVRPVVDAAAQADIIMMLVPDQAARAVYEAEVAPCLGGPKTLLFAHGFNIHFGEIVPPASVWGRCWAGRGSTPRVTTRRGARRPAKKGWARSTWTRL